MGGGKITGYFSYSWEYGAYTFVSDESQTKELYAFDERCSAAHHGEFHYGTGSCPETICERLNLKEDQAQLFYEDGADYYNYPPTATALGDDGIAVWHYEPNPDYLGNPQSVAGLWLDTLTDKIIRVEFTNGRIFDFLETTYGEKLPDDFAEPIDCKCRRTVDALIMVDVGGPEGPLLRKYVKPYLTRLVGGFDLTAGSNFGLYEYDGGATHALTTIENGNSAGSVLAAVGRIGECQTSNVCTHLGSGDTASAIHVAIADHANSESAKVLIMVTPGWLPDETNGGGSTQADVVSAFDAAQAAGITVLSVVHNSLMFGDSLVPIHGGIPSNMVEYYRSEQLETAQPHEINGLICALDNSPCGSDCCGYCDTTCSVCYGLSSCPDSGDCNNNFQLTFDGCCELFENSPFCEEPDSPLPCQQAVCNAVSGECEIQQCSASDNSCYAYTCNAVLGVCEKSLKAIETPCQVPTCNEGNGSYEVIWTERDCSQPDDLCTTWSCVEGVGCTGTPTPAPVPAPPCKTNARCDPAQGWIYDDVECLGSPCAPSECTAASSPLCEVTPQCVPDPTNLCDLNTCDNGICSNAVVECPELACQVNMGCNPGTGACEYEPVDCSGTCAVRTCDSATNECVVVDSSPCGTCLDDCGNNACSTTTCELGQCQDDTVLTDCSSEDTCVNTSCDPVNGCTEEPVVCPAPANECEVITQDPSAPGCCVTTTKNCVPDGGGELCTVYTCHPELGCIAEPKFCATPTCYDVDRRYRNTGGCNPSSGACDGFVPRDCSTATCEESSCKPEENACTVDHYDNCECNCPNTECVQYSCVQGQCTDPVETECAPSNICETNSRCNDNRGCVVDEVDCSGLTPPPCQEYYKNPQHPTACCQLRPVTCLSDGCQVERCVVSAEVPQGQCQVVDGSACPCPQCEVNACEINTCAYNSETFQQECVLIDETSCEAANNCETNPSCTPENGCTVERIKCFELTPDPCMKYVEDPYGTVVPGGTECCVQVPVECTSVGCERRSCVASEQHPQGQCEVTSRETCACEPECTVDLCEKNSCVYNEQTLQPECQTQETTECVPPNTCQRSVGCDPDTGCQFEEITCDDLTPDPCMEYEADPTAQGCCVQKPVECSSNDCNVLECVTDVTPQGSCEIVDSSGCICDPETCINNRCTRSPCVNGVCGDPVTTECTVSDSCHENARCDVNARGDGCVEDEVDCGTPPPCKQFVKDPSTPNCCVLEDVVCAEPGCEKMVCDSDSSSATYGECVELNRDLCPCDLPRHTDPETGCLVNDACQVTPCVNGECGEPDVVDCKASDHCHDNVRCDPNSGCQEDEVVCPEAPTCQYYTRDPATPGCCVLNDQECPQTGCETMTCDATEGSATLGECVVLNRDQCPCDQPRHVGSAEEEGCLVNNVCVKTACVLGECDEPVETVCEASDSCHTNARCDLASDGCVEDEVDCGEPPACHFWEKNPGVAECCVAVPTDCSSPGCEVFECNESNNQCEIVDQSQCSCTCPTTFCTRYECNAGTCSAPIARDCDTPPNTCKEAGVCSDEEGQCVYADVECAPPVECQRLRLDPSEPGCCVYEDVLCPAADTPTYPNLCFRYTGECGVESDACQVTPVICPDLPCKSQAPEFGANNGCDPDTGICRYVENKCVDENTGCEEYKCNPDSNMCELDNTRLCSICDPVCVNNKCVKTQCTQQKCEESVETICPASDFCHTASCDPEIGCINTEVECPPDPDLCSFYTKDPTNPDCCVLTPRPCAAATACNAAATCDLETGSCVAGADLCVAQSTHCSVGFCNADNECEVRSRTTHTCPELEDRCQVASCSAQGECEYEARVCTAPNACFTAECNPETGSCTSSEVRCDDNKSCTTDTCNTETGECSHVEHCDDGDLCTNESCSETTGKCVSTPVNCDDGFSCTVDSCDSASGECIHNITATSDAKCQSADPCKVTVCDPTSDTADPKTGCAFVPFECDASDNFCTSRECVAFTGCVTSLTECRELSYVEAGYDTSENSTNPPPVVGTEDCDLHTCSYENGGQCLVEEKECTSAYIGFVAVAAAALGTTAIVLIIAGIALCCCCSAAGIGAIAYKRRNDDEEDPEVSNNPLYESNSSKGENPLFKNFMSSGKKRRAKYA
eukprot:TRINITY_DN208_c0_g1_i2.p1 TRINITY_DN208_c0_g1~~TRINITY_DN208_c0_g1_i2.p1  ORF type:complete len:2443 (-),score=374.22 TRINITY_DN208_c0_g1_i2:133-6513(-)